VSFFRKHIGIWRKEDVDWNEINKVLLIEKKLLFASDVDLKSMSEEQLENWSYYIGQNTVNCIITSAALGNEDEIKYGFEIIYERIKHEVLDGIRYHRCSKDEIHFWYSYNAHNQASILFRSAIRGLQAIRKSNYALSYLLQYTAGWEKYYGEKTEDLLPVYQDIVDCAEDAIKYGPSDQISSYKEVHSKYQDLIAEITDTATYKVRPVDDNDI